MEFWYSVRVDGSHLRDIPTNQLTNAHESPDILERAGLVDLNAYLLEQEKRGAIKKPCITIQNPDYTAFPHFGLVDESEMPGIHHTLKVRFKAKATPKIYDDHPPNTGYGTDTSV